MICANCGRDSNPAEMKGLLCLQCQPPKPQPKFYIYEVNMPGGLYLQWNGALQIMESTGDRKYAAHWDREEAAQYAAEFYGHVWHARNMGDLKVVRFD